MNRQTGKADSKLYSTIRCHSFLNFKTLKCEVMPDSDAGIAPKTMATSASGSQTVLHVEGSDGRGAASPAVLKLKLKKPPPSRRVQWTEDTVDNEHMNKKVTLASTSVQTCIKLTAPANFFWIAARAFVQIFTLPIFKTTLTLSA